MDLILDTSNVQFQASRGFEPRLDKDGNQRRDKQGGTNLPLHAAQLVAWCENGAETILVTVATDNPPTLTPGQSVAVDRLQAMPWVQQGSPRVAFRAKSVLPVNGSPSKSHAVASAAN
jgi:hypothetical protein